MYQNHIWLFFLQNHLYIGKNSLRDIKKRLLIPHNIEIIVWYNAESLENLIQHLPMLGCYTYNDLNARPFLQLIHKRAYLYCFRPCSKNQHYFFHMPYSLFLLQS